MNEMMARGEYKRVERKQGSRSGLSLCFRNRANLALLKERNRATSGPSDR